MTKPSFEDYPEDRHTALKRIQELMRTLNAATIRFDDSAEVLNAFAEKLDRLVDEAESLATEKPFLPFRVGLPEHDINSMIPFSPITGRYNPVSPPLELSVEDGRLIGEAVFDERFEGPNQSLHGSYVSAVYDQMLASANVIDNVAGPTASLTVYFRKPTPLFEPLRFEAWTESSKGRKTRTKGRCLAGDEVVSEAEGLFIRLDPNRDYPQWSNRPAGRTSED
jgi:hypothetical protein